MDRWVRTNRFSGAPLDNRYIGPKSGHLDLTSFVSVQILPECNFQLNWGAFPRLIAMISLMLMIWFLVPKAPKKDE